MKTAGLLLLALGALLAAFVWLVPAHSLPIGFDAYWNLHVAKTWAEGGFPAAMPEAAFTTLAERYVDRQLAFDALLALLGGRDLGLDLAPPVIWAMVVVQAIVLFVCIRALAPAATPLWILLLPALSFTWTFRNCALRDMNLAVCTLLALLTLLTLRARGRRVPGLALAACGAAFGYLHALLLLPLALGVLFVLARRKGALDLAWLAGGLLVPLVLTPNFPHGIAAAWIWNVRFPLATLGGVLIAPSEFAPYELADLLRWNTPLLFAVVVLLVLVAQRRTERALALPVLAVCIAGLVSRRMFEVATPLLILALADARCGRLPRTVVALALVVWPWHLHEAQRSTAANRHPEFVAVAAWLREQGRRDDVVFVTDWALTSPLAWFTRGSSLRFTGVIDTSTMWAADAARSAAWHRIKRGEDPEPISTIAADFTARLLVQSVADTSPGRPLGATAAYLYDALDRAERSGWHILSTQIGKWKCYCFDPPR